MAPLEEHLRNHPEDWTSWLVYGDWLLEQGDARGELIAAQRGYQANLAVVERATSAYQAALQLGKR